jgi:3-phosphoinositide dependent protein kinase-1
VKKKLSSEDFVYIRSVGKGAFGLVYLAARKGGE